MRISLTLPSGSSVELGGTIREVVGEGGMEGRGPGIDIALLATPQSVMWLIESALTSAGITPRPVQDKQQAAVSTTPVPPEDDQDLAEGDEVINAEGDLVKALWQELSLMSKMNSFQLLDVPYEATDKEVRAAFGALSKKYHPDRFTRYESFEIRELANEVFILLRNAYRSVADEKGRAEALKTIDSAGDNQSPPAPQASPSRKSAPPIPSRAAAAPKIPRAQTANEAPARGPQTPPPNRAQTAPPTRAQTAPPVAASPDRVAMAMGILESGQYEQALRILRAEARKNPNNMEALAGVELAEGRLALVQGDRMEAAQRFEAALDLDPSNERAAREIAEMRRHATEQRRGVLSKLMKKV